MKINRIPHFVRKCVHLGAILCRSTLYLVKLVYLFLKQ